MRARKPTCPKDADDDKDGKDATGTPAGTGTFPQGPVLSWRGVTAAHAACHQRVVATKLVTHPSEGVFRVLWSRTFWLLRAGSLPVS